MQEYFVIDTTLTNIPGARDIILYHENRTVINPMVFSQLLTKAGPLH